MYLLVDSAPTTMGTIVTCLGLIATQGRGQSASALTTAAQTKAE